MPAFWWLYNMYALARNSWKFQSRDKRLNKVQHIEIDPLAPDTVEEILNARRLLELWTGKADARRAGQPAEALSEEDLIQRGRTLLNGSGKELAGLEVLGETMEKTHRKAVIGKPREGYKAYEQMLHYYAVRNLISYLQTDTSGDFAAMQNVLCGPRKCNWVNLGGQLVPVEDADRLRADVVSGSLDSWEAIHQRYDELWAAYPLEKQKHAWAVLCGLYGCEILSREQWLDALKQSASIQDFICEQVYLSRKKDFENPFRQATFRNDEEMAATIGTIDDNSFVQQVRKETEEYKQACRNVSS